MVMWPRCGNAAVGNFAISSPAGTRSDRFLKHQKKPPAPLPASVGNPAGLVPSSSCRPCCQQNEHRRNRNASVSYSFNSVGISTTGHDLCRQQHKNADAPGNTFGDHCASVRNNP